MQYLAFVAAIVGASDDGILSSVGGACEKEPVAHICDVVSPGDDMHSVKAVRTRTQ